MGEVYVARSQDSDELFALKVLRPAFRNKRRSLLRFELESFALDSIRCKNVLRFVESGWIEDPRSPFPYLVTELVQGPNLHELVAVRGGLPFQQACDFICQVADGLASSHAAGFIHRDVKPSNVVISPTGTAKLIDFGLALYTGDAERFRTLSQPSHRKSVGTARFSAPEQLIEADSVGAQADVYGIGATFLYALTGKMLPAELAGSHCSAAIEILNESRPGLPTSVRDSLNGMLANKAVDRFENAQDSVAALRQFATRFPVEINFEGLLRARLKQRKQLSKLGQQIAKGKQFKPSPRAFPSTRSDGDSGAEPTADESRNDRDFLHEEPHTCKRLFTENQQLHSLLNTSQAQMGRIEKQFANELGEMRRERDEVQTQLTTCQAQVKQLSEQNQLKDRLVTSYGMELEGSQLELARAAQNASAQSEQVIELKSQIQADNLRFSSSQTQYSETRDVAISISAQLIGTEVASEAVRRELASMTRLASAHEQQIQKLQGELSKSQSDHLQLTNELDAMRKQAIEQRSHALIKEAILRAQVEELMHQLSEDKLSEQRTQERLKRQVYRREMQQTMLWRHALKSQLDAITSATPADMLDAVVLLDLAARRLEVSEHEIQSTN